MLFIMSEARIADLSKAHDKEMKSNDLSRNKKFIAIKLKPQTWGKTSSKY